MPANNSDGQVDAVTAFWRQLCSYLDARIHLEGPDIDGDLEVTLTVESSAPTGPEFPEISFHEPRIARGDTRGGTPHRFRSTRAQLETTSINITAQVFASYEHPGWTVTREFDSLGPVLNDSVRRYQGSLAALNLRGRLSTILADINKPNSETTVAQLDSVKEQVKAAFRAVNTVSSEVQALESPFSQSLDPILSMATTACNEVRQRISTLQESLGGGYSGIQTATAGLDKPLPALDGIDRAVAGLFGHFS